MITIKTLMVAAALAAAVTLAKAETFTYACKVTGVEPNPNNTYLFAAVSDSAKHTLTWRGTTYRNVKRVFRTFEGECAKYCESNGVVTLSTATQGAGILWITPAVEGAGNEMYLCDVVRKK